MRISYQRNSPYQVRCGSITAMAACIAGAPGREQHFVGPVVRHGIGIDADALEVAAGVGFRPAPDDVAAQRDDLPGLELGRPSRHLLGMLPHELLHARLERLADGAQLGVEFLVVLLRNLAVPPHALAVILEDPRLCRTPPPWCLRPCGNCAAVLPAGLPPARIPTRTPQPRRWRRKCAARRIRPAESLLWWLRTLRPRQPEAAQISS